MEEEFKEVTYKIKTINKRNYRINKINPSYYIKAPSCIIEKESNSKIRKNSFEYNDDIDSYSGDSDFLKDNDDNYIPQEFEEK